MSVVLAMFVVVRAGLVRRGSARDDRLYELAARITERDRVICRLLHEHRVLTTSQLTAVAFSSLRKAQERLSLLYGLEVVDRFRHRSWSGTGPFHFTLGRTGAAVVASERGVTIAELGWQRATTTALATSGQLAHLVGCNGVFTDLIAAARRTPGASLEQWWSARRCAAAWGDAIRPDGYGVYVEGEVRLPFLLEYDTGSETLPRLEAKLPGYAALARAVEHPTWVCFCFLSLGTGGLRPPGPRPSRGARRHRCRRAGQRPRWPRVARDRRRRPTPAPRRPGPPGPRPRPACRGFPTPRPVSTRA